MTACKQGFDVNRRRPVGSEPVLTHHASELQTAVLSKQFVVITRQVVLKSSSEHKPKPKPDVKLKRSIAIDHLRDCESS